MKNFNKKVTINFFAFFFAFLLGLTGSMTTFAAGPNPVNLGTAGNFVILAKTGISTTGTTSITGNVGISPAAASYMTGFGLILPAASDFSTSSLVTGKLYAPGYANPTPVMLTTAILDMQTAYTDATSRAPSVTELGAGNIGGLTIAPGTYKWSTAVNIPTNITLSGAADDVWIFQVAKNLTVSSAVKIILEGGAQSRNVFWVVAGQTTIGTTVSFNGNILDQTAIILNTGASLNGRALAQSAVTLNSNAVNIPSTTVVIPSPVTTSGTQLTCSNLYWIDTTDKTCQSQKQFCGAFMYKGLQTFSTQQECLATVGQLTNPSSAPSPCSNLYWIDTTDKTCQSQKEFCGAFMYQGLQTFSTQQECLTTVGQLTISSSTLSSCSDLYWFDSKDMTCQSQKQFCGAFMYQGLQTFSTQQECLNTASQQVTIFDQSIKTIKISLALGSRGSDVAILQQFLISQNKGPAAQSLSRIGATSYFGILTRAALAEFQGQAGITPAVGYFGIITRNYLNLHY